MIVAEEKNWTLMMTEDRLYLYCNCLGAWRWYYCPTERDYLSRMNETCCDTRIPKHLLDLAGLLYT